MSTDMEQPTAPVPPSLPTARALVLKTDNAELAGDHEYGCASWSEKTTINWNSFQNLKPFWLFFNSLTALFSSMVKTLVCALALGKACREV